MGVNQSENWNHMNSLFILYVHVRVCVLNCHTSNKWNGIENFVFDCKQFWTSIRLSAKPIDNIFLSKSQLPQVDWMPPGLAQSLPLSLTLASLIQLPLKVIPKVKVMKEKWALKNSKTIKFGQKWVKKRKVHTKEDLQLFSLSLSFSLSLHMHALCVPSEQILVQIQINHKPNLPDRFGTHFHC